MHHNTLTEYLNITQDNAILHNLSPLIKTIASCATDIASIIATASIDDNHGITGCINVQGEHVQHLDILADTLFTKAIEQSGVVAGVVSEEQEHPIIFSSNTNSRYLVAIDPLDGSSNIDTNNTIGTIFCVFERTSSNNDSITEEEFLQNGKSCLCAGYIAYGPATTLVFSTGKGVQCCTYSPIYNDFILTHTTLLIPKEGNSYSVNEGYRNTFDTKTKEYLQAIQNNTPYSLRYVGSLVADIHRTLLKGGIFIYPTQYKNGEKKDKLRLLYECIPIAFLIEQAGGMAHNGQTPITSITPKTLHERSSLYCGSLKEMQLWNSILH